MTKAVFCYIFGYGSLINMAYNTGELEEVATKPFWPIMVKGLQRTKNVLLKDKKHVVFGVKDHFKQSCNGILFPVNKDEFTRLRIREGLYDPIRLQANRILTKYGPASQYNFVFNPSTVKIYCFYPKEKTLTTNNKLPFWPGYLKICYDGCRQISDQFYKDFIMKPTTVKTIRKNKSQTRTKKKTYK